MAFTLGTRRGAFYRYRIWRRPEPSPFERRRSWWVARPVDEGALAESAALLLGEHDFRRPHADADEAQVFVRSVESAVWRREGHVLVFEMTANSFLRRRHVPETAVGTILELSRPSLQRLLREVCGPGWFGGPHRGGST